MVLVASPSKPLLLTEKRTIRKGATLQQYDEEIKALYRPDEAVRGDEGLERLDDPHRAQRVRHHHLDEVLQRHLADGHLLVGGGPGVDEQQVEDGPVERATQLGDAVGVGDVESLDADEVRQALALRSAV